MYECVLIGRVREECKGIGMQGANKQRTKFKELRANAKIKVHRAKINQQKKTNECSQGVGMGVSGRGDAG